MTIDEARLIGLILFAVKKHGKNCGCKACKFHDAVMSGLDCIDEETRVSDIFNFVSKLRGDGGGE